MFIRWKYRGRHTAWHKMLQSTSQVTNCGLLIKTVEGEQERSETEQVTCVRCIAAEERMVKRNQKIKP